MVETQSIGTECLKTTSNEAAEHVGSVGQHEIGQCRTKQCAAGQTCRGEHVGTRMREHHGGGGGGECAVCGV